MKGYAQLTDIWSLGIVMHHLLTGDFPFYDMNDDKLLAKAVDGQIVFTGHRFRHVSLPAMDLLKKCLATNPNERTTANAAFNHGFFDPSAMERDLIRRGL